MSVTAPNVTYGNPAGDDTFLYGHASATGNVINPGDWVIWSGNYLAAAEDAQAYWKVSGAGIAMGKNPMHDEAGRTITNTALLIVTHGIFRVSAAFSGQPLYGVIARPATTGSGVNAPSGVTGVAATWVTAVPGSVSGGTAANVGQGVAQVINWINSGPAGTGQMDIRVWPRNADYY